MKLLMEHEAKEILEKHGIPTARCIFAESEEEAVKAASQIGFPVVMKVAGRKIIHKSDVGGVALNIQSEDGVRETFRRLMAIGNAEGVNLQPMLEKGIEVIVGVAENEQFGSVVMFGLGGIFAEVLRDVSFRLLPLTTRDAEEMVREIRGYRLLEGYRGVRGDVRAVVELLVKVGEMVEEEGIVEMDLNPVFVYENGLRVADARMVVGERRRFDYRVKDVEDVLKPESVAVVGASSNPIKVGYSVVKSLRTGNVRVYPVNPRVTEIDGLKCYSSLRSLPEVPDLVVVALPYDRVLKAVEDAVELGVRGVLIITSGFKEAEYEEGRILEMKLKWLASRGKTRIIGPNTFGFVNVSRRINASFTPMFGELEKGKIALVSQSGGICHYVMHEFRNAGFSYIIHLGNRCDVDFHDVFSYLREDTETDVVAVYVEGIDNGRAFYEELKKLAEKKKVVVMKSGKSSVADRASLSHTGSMAGDYKIFISAVKQAGAIPAETPIELMDTALALERFGKLEGGVAILSIQAGLGIVASDILESNGGRLSKFSNRTIKRLKDLLPPITMRENPVDLSFSGLDLEKFVSTVESVSEDDDVALVMFLYAVAPPSWVIPPEVMKGIMERVTKPVIVVYSSTPENFKEVEDVFRNSNVLVFDSVERAATAAAKVCKRNNF